MANTQSAEGNNGKRKFRIGVRELVEYRQRSGDLDLTFFGAPTPLEGIRLHKKIQSGRPEEYSSEIPISATLESEDIVLIVSGRIDGVFEYSDGVVVEEIKTTRKDPDDLEIPDDHPYWAQVRCYGYMLAKDRNLGKICLQLACCNVESEKIRVIRREFSFSELEAFFLTLADACFQQLRAEIAWGQRRDFTLRAMEFPFEKYRNGQRKMAVAVFRTIRDKGQAIIQAPTGIGKTMAVLFSALKAMAAEHAEKIFYLTARSTGKAAAENALKIMKNAGISIKSVTLTAKEKICFSPGSLCNGQECEFAEGFYDRVRLAVEELLRFDVIDRVRIEAVAAEYRVCPFEFTLEACHFADVLICDYNYAFDPRVCLKRFFRKEKKNYAFLVDEAHNLVDRGREMFSAQLSRSCFVELLVKMEENEPVVRQILGETIEWFSDLENRGAENGGFQSSPEPPESLYPPLERFVHVAESWFLNNRKSPVRADMVDVYFQASNFLKISGLYNECYASVFEKSESDIRTRLFCLDPAGPLKNALKRCGSAIFFSATMTPADYFGEVLGCDGAVMTMRLPSPFPTENCLVFVADRISTYYKRRSETKDALARTLISLAGQKKGNYLFFFPSYAYLEMVLDVFEKSNGKFRTLAQNRTMNDADRETFLETFEEDTGETLAGFAVTGGVFGEGIDMAGERLSAAAVVGVGLPMICPERELIRKYYEDKHGEGFDYAYKFPGINRVLQAAGRVIRSETDRGVVLLIDERFSRSDYKRLLPEHWNIERIGSRADFEKALRNFWATA